MNYPTHTGGNPLYFTVSGWLIKQFEHLINKTGNAASCPAAFPVYKTVDLCSLDLFLLPGKRLLVDLADKFILAVHITFRVEAKFLREARF